MKIVDRKTFLALPAGALYSKFEPCIFGELNIKGDTVGENDFYTQQIADAVYCNDSNEFADILLSSAKTGESFSMDFNCERRDGVFDREQLFAIWEPSDVSELIERLTRLVGSNV